MIYTILKISVQYFLRIFFSKLSFHNKEAIPQKGPVILAMNHPTAFIDPIFVCTHIRPTTHFILRGDLFNTRFNRWFLNEIRTIPIFRKRDGFANLKKNEASLEYCHEVLNNKGHIIILAEGETKHEKRLRPIQKGTARMAFGTYEKYGNEDTLIIPIGLNYTDSVRFRSELLVEVGDPIAIKDYMEVYQENPRRAILQVTREIQRQLKERVVHIADPADETWIDQLLLLNRNEHLWSSWPPLSDENLLLREEIQLAQKANQMEAEQKQRLSAQLSAYFDRIKAAQISDRGLVQSKQYNWKNNLFLLIGFPFFLIGYLCSFIPMTIAKNVADTKIKRMEFYSSVRLGVCLGVSFVQMLILLIIGSLVAWLWKSILPIVAILLIPLFGFFSVQYRDVFVRWNEARLVKRIDMQERETLLAERTQLLKQFRVGLQAQPASNKSKV